MNEAVVFGVNSGALINSSVTYVGGGGSPGDFDTDGDVDGRDFLTWQRQLGQSAVAVASQIPEPAASLLLLTAAIFMHCSKLLP